MTTSSITDATTLANGVKMPWLGFGTFKIEDGRLAEDSVKSALEAGYRHIDTAKIYGNEASVGRAIKSSAIPRDQLFVTTKVWNSDQGYESTLAAMDESLQRLDMDYVDLYLVHWPVKGKYLETWKALETIYEQGKAKAIGVSNFQIHHLDDVLGRCKVVPMVNQIELHPLLSQVPLRTFCAGHNIRVEAWSPIMRGEAGLQKPEIAQLAAKHGKTPAQIVLRWDLQHELVTIPKSATPSRIAENAQIFDFELSHDDMSLLDGINQDQRLGPDPDDFSF